MKNQIENILVFATNVKTETDKRNISLVLDENPAIEQWNIDLEDVDSVLRIVSDTLSEEEIISTIKSMDFKCLPLD
jgi:cell fate (sporulation/competence/biofilm development) regulator YmcA (YheA/YmcA/DUF963 family)